MRKLFTNKNKKGFAMAELLAVSIVLLFIFSILFSNYLPLLAEYETRLSYNDVTAQYAAHYIRKMYKEALDDTTDLEGGTTKGKKLESTISQGINDNGYFTVYKEDKNIDEIKNHVLDKDENNYKKIINEYGIEEIIITRYKLKGNKDATETTKYVKDEDGYKKDAGYLYNYIGYLPNYEKSIYTGKTQNGEEEQLYRLILKTKDYGYATTPILSDYKTPGSCFEGVSNGDGTTLTITKYRYNENNGCGKEVIIKNNNVKLYNGVSGKITKIGEKTFKDMPIEKVTLSDVYYIGDSAFENTGLSSMPMPSLNNIKFIGSRAFANTQIEEVDLSGDRTIGDYAFANNKKLGKVSLPNANIYSSGRTLSVGLFKESGTDASGTDVSGIAVNIPNGMTDIGDEMFYLAKINGITLNDGVKTIGNRAFSQYNNQTKEGTGKADNVTITANVESIGEDSFRGLSITKLTFNEGKDSLSIGTAAFKQNAIGYLEIPSRVNSIGANAFDSSGIQTLIFKDGSQLQNIPLSAFAYNQLAGTLIIPDSVTEIESSAFYNNNNSLNVELPERLEKIGKQAFMNTQLGSIIIRGGVNYIGISAFQNAGLEANGVTIIDDSNIELTIDNFAFAQNQKLTEFTIPKRTTKLNYYVFTGISNSGDAKIINKSSKIKSDLASWCIRFVTNINNCDCIQSGDNELKIVYLGADNRYYTRYVYNEYNMGGVTNE